MSRRASFAWPPRRLRLLALGLGLAAALGAAALAGRPWAGSGAGPAGKDADTLAVEIERLLQAPAAMAAAPDLRAQLELQQQRHPHDVRALVLMARLDMEQQRYDQAAAGYEQALQAVNSKAARDPDVWVEYAEAVGMQQGRTLAGKPLQLVQRALALDARHAAALDLAGSAAWEAKDYAAAAVHWKQLLQQLPAGTARHAELTAAIGRAEQRARLSLPPPRP